MNQYLDGAHINATHITHTVFPCWFQIFVLVYDVWNNVGSKCGCRWGENGTDSASISDDHFILDLSAGSQMLLKLHLPGSVMTTGVSLCQVTQPVHLANGKSVNTREQGTTSHLIAPSPTDFLTWFESEFLGNIWFVFPCQLLAWLVKTMN